MTDERQHDDERLAAYLGGEMSEDDRRRFEAAMGENPALADEVRGLRRALEAMRSLDDRTVSEAPRPRVVVKWGGAVLRYAAIIGLAFAAGYFLRGGDVDSSQSQTAIEQASPSEDDWFQRAAERYVTGPRGPSFARSLVAIAESGGAVQGEIDSD